MNQKFVCVAVNTEGDPSAGSSQAHAPSDQAGRCSPGIGNQNVQTLFLTPDKKIFHTASGFQDAQQLVREMDFAQDLFKELQRSPAMTESTVRKEHYQRMLKAGYSKQALENAVQPSPLFGRQQVNLAGFPRLSQSAQTRQPLNIFAGKTEKSRMLDYQFSQRHPMLEWDKFERNPRMLVGNAVTAFASGNASGGRIGGNSPANISVSSSGAPK